MAHEEIDLGKVAELIRSKLHESGNLHLRETQAHVELSKEAPNKMLLTVRFNMREHRMFTSADDIKFHWVNIPSRSWYCSFYNPFWMTTETVVAKSFEFICHEIERQNWA